MKCTGRVGTPVDELRVWVARSESSKGVGRASRASNSKFTISRGALARGSRSDNRTLARGG